MLEDMRDRMKSRVGIYGTGWNPESVMGLLLPFVIIIVISVIGFLFIAAINS